ncbi:MAG: pantetheine-phosphate adenylyltransferase [Candidatus Aenigmatarchaeota archaeon]
MCKIALYPGTFDPVTYGHIDVIKRALKLFDKIIVAVAENPRKELLFSTKERIQMIRDATKGLNIDVESFDTLLVDYVKKKKIRFVIRGLRAVSDFDREFQMAVANKDMNNEIETIFIITDKKYFYLNSTLVKEVARCNGPLKNLVPKNVEKKLREKFKK